MKNLKVIYEAIQTFQAEQHDLPNWLSDLVPQYLADMNALMCPVCRRTGQTEPPPLADPKLPCSYLFEFCPIPLTNMNTFATNRTRREWKRRQMGLLGSVVPMVRCRMHQKGLNLTFDGRVYESEQQWELTFTNRIALAELNPDKLFASDRGGGGGRFPQRDPKARPGLINLTKFYNHTLNDGLQGKTNNNLAALPKGLQKIDGTEFDLRGLIQLSTRVLTNKPYSREAKNIPVNQKAKRLVFLHAAANGDTADEGKQIGSYFIYYTNNPARLEIPIVYGRDLRNWHPQEAEPEDGARPAWTGENAISKVTKQPIRLYKTTWTNLAPDAVIEKIDFVSSTAAPAPFLVAITAE